MVAAARFGLGVGHGPQLTRRRKPCSRSSRGVSKIASGGALLDDAAAVHEEHAVGDLAGELHLVGDDEHGLALDGDAAQKIEHLADPFGVEGGGGLVDQHQLGVERHRPADADALLLAAGERGGIGAAAVGEADLGQDGVGAGVGLGGGLALDGDQRLGDVLPRGLVGEERVVLEDEGGAAAQREDVAAGGAGGVDGEAVRA